MTPSMLIILFQFQFCGFTGILERHHLKENVAAAVAVVAVAVAVAVAAAARPSVRFYELPTKEDRLLLQLQGGSGSKVYIWLQACFFQVLLH